MAFEISRAMVRRRQLRTAGEAAEGNENDILP
jgi:hypothetical protein